MKDTKGNKDMHYHNKPRNYGHCLCCLLVVFVLITQLDTFKLINARIRSNQFRFRFDVPGDVQ